MVLTHLVQLKFFHGATVNEAVVPVTFAGHTTFPPFYAFKGFTLGEPVPEPAPSGQVDIPGGTSKRKRKRPKYIWEDAHTPVKPEVIAVPHAAAAQEATDHIKILEPGNQLSEALHKARKRRKRMALAALIALLSDEE